MATQTQINDLVKQAIRHRLDQVPGGGGESETPPAPEPSQLPEIVLASGQQLFSKLVPGNRGVTFRPDFAVSILDTSTLPSQVAPFVPELNPHYIPDITSLALLLLAFETNDTTLITGPTGCGKSELVKYACALTKRPFIRVNMTEDIESSVIFGTLVARGGSTVWEDGPAAEAVRYGAVLNIDEWDVTPPGVFMGLQWLLEHDGCLFLKEMPGTAADKILKPHPNFRVVMNGNTVGQGDESGSFAGTTVQNTASIDRFRTTLRMKYMPEQDEVLMLTTAVPGLPVASARQMVSLAGLVRSGYEQGQLGLTMSPRTLLNWAQKIEKLGMRRAINVAYSHKLTDVNAKVFDGLYSKVFGNS